MASVVPPVPYRTVALERGVFSELITRWLNLLLAAVNASVIKGTFANNAAALAGGLLVGDVYRTATGEVRVVV